MKRKGLSWLLCFVLILSLFTGLTGFADASSFLRTAKVGEKVWWVFDAIDLSGPALVSGSLPPGLNLGMNQDCYIIHGTPTTAGEWTAYIYRRM